MFKNLVIRKATLIDIVLSDDTEYKLTDYFHDIDTYSVSNFSVSNLQESVFQPYTNCEVSRIVNSNLRDHAIRDELIGAVVTVTIMDMETEETYILFKGFILTVTIMDNWIDIDCVSKSYLFDQDLNVYTSDKCTNDLGDSKCLVELASYTETGTVTTGNSTNRMNLVDNSRSEANDYFNAGKLTFTGGDNNGVVREVRLFQSDKFHFFIPTPYDIAIGDTYSVYRGCEKTQDDCQGTFDNWSKFRGYGLHTPNYDDLKFVPEGSEEDDADSEDSDYIVED